MHVTKHTAYNHILYFLMSDLLIGILFPLFMSLNLSLFLSAPACWCGFGKEPFYASALIRLH